MNNVIGEPDPLAITIELGQDKGLKQIFMERPEILPTNAIKAELESFSNAIMHNTPPSVTAGDGLLALDIAYRIIEKLTITSHLLV